MTGSAAKRVLAFDTTSDFGGIAIAENGRVVEEVLLRSDDGFAHILFQQIETLLARHGWTLESVDVFAAGAGPGSFTGVRVGLAAAKGLAETLGRRAAAVSNLAALASVGTAPLRAAFFDARRGEIYGAVYDSGGRLVSNEVVEKFPAWIESLPDGDLQFVTHTPSLYAPLLAGSRFDRTPFVEAPRAIAGRIALLARGADPAAIDANYVRRSDAELFWRE